MEFESDSNKKFTLRKTQSRVPIWKNAVEKVLPLISQKSDTQAVDHSMVLAQNYIERMREAKKEHEGIEEEIEELQKRQKELERKWETEEISFDDL